MRATPTATCAGCSTTGSRAGADPLGLGLNRLCGGLRALLAKALQNRLDRLVGVIGQEEELLVRRRDCPGGQQPPVDPVDQPGPELAADQPDRAVEHLPRLDQY